MINPLVHAFWEQKPVADQREQTLDVVGEKVQRAIALIREGMTRKGAIKEVGIPEKTFYRRLQQLGLAESLPNTRPKRVKQAPQFAWPLYEAKGLLWHGTSEEETAAAVGVSLATLQRGLAKNMDWCRATGRCIWCEILLAHAEGREGEMCSECAEVLRGKPVLLREDEEKA